ILGAGLAGVELGRKLKELKKDFVIFEKESQIGGICRTNKTGEYYWDCTLTGSTLNLKVPFFVSSSPFFSITSLVAGSPKYPNENVIVESTFATKNGSVTPDTIDMTIWKPNYLTVWYSANKNNFNVSNGIWYWTQMVEASPTTGTYYVNMKATYNGYEDSKTTQFRIATGGPYKVVLQCPDSSNVGENLNCNVIIKDEGEAATESTSTVWVDTNNNLIADSGESQTSFSKQTVPLQNVTQPVSINVPSSHSTGLYVVRVTTSYANSGQPDSTASDSVTLNSVAAPSAGPGGGGGGGGGGSVTSNKSSPITGKTITPLEAVTPSKETSQTFASVIPDSPVTMVITDSDFGIKEITIKVNNEAQNVKVNVAKYDSKPSEVPVEKSGSIYKYLEIKGDNLGDKLKQATITIEVEKSWLEENGLDKRDIVIFKFEDGEWKELPTILKEATTITGQTISEIESKGFFSWLEIIFSRITGRAITRQEEAISSYIYEVKTDSFGYFVIGGGGGGGITGETIKYPEHLMDISTRILDEYKSISPGDKILMELSLYNLGTEEIKDAKIRYCIETAGKKIIKCSEEVVAIYTKIQLVKEFLISQNIEDGEYFIKTEATYGNETVFSETSFEVISSEFSAQQEIKLNRWLIIIIII
ncbi:MAG: PGF-pre-PGF domain-containing protein, partial [Nanoarchaeota archaeon]|nr:PGF-pre-PGF domain-containing protein [Nanoarchaeota archaeon]